MRGNHIPGLLSVRRTNLCIFKNFNFGKFSQCLVRILENEAFCFTFFQAPPYKMRIVFSRKGKGFSTQVKRETGERENENVSRDEGVIRNIGGGGRIEVA